MTKTLRLGDVEVGRIGLGTNRLKNTPENVAFIRDAVETGVSHIDTAYLYTRGESEETIGAALNPIPESVVVATKGGYNRGEGRPEVLRSQIEESLRRLRTEVIPLYYLHRVDPETSLEESLGVIAEYRDQGRIRNVGISEVSVESRSARLARWCRSPLSRTSTASAGESTRGSSTTAPAKAFRLFPTSRCAASAQRRSPTSQPATV